MAAVGSMAVDSVEASTAAEAMAFMAAVFVVGTSVALAAVSVGFTTALVTEASGVFAATASSLAAGRPGSSDLISALLLTGTDIRTPTAMVLVPGGDPTDIPTRTATMTITTIAMILPIRVTPQIIVTSVETIAMIGRRAIPVRMAKLPQRSP